MQEIQIPYYINDIAEKFSLHKSIEAVLFGGSVYSYYYDHRNGYSLYIYSDSKIDFEFRKETAKIFSDYSEFTDELDVWLESGYGTTIKVYYKRLNELQSKFREMFEEKKIPRSTEFWNQLLSSRILFERTNTVSGLKEKYSGAYTDEIQELIIKTFLDRLYRNMSSYLNRIKSAVRNRDFPLIFQEINNFIFSAFEIIFALNKKKFPGNKYAVKTINRECSVKPIDLSLKTENIYFSVKSELDLKKVTDNLYVLLDDIKDLCRDFIY